MKIGEYMCAFASGMLTMLTIVMLNTHFASQDIKFVTTNDVLNETNSVKIEENLSKIGE